MRREFYIYIPEGKIGRIEDKKSSQVMGFCTNHITTCIIIALVSQKTGRYVFIHADNSLDICKVISEQKSWVGEEASFFIYYRDREYLDNARIEKLAELNKLKPTETVLMEDAIECITLKLGDSKPCPELNLPSNTLFHKKQVLIYLQHRIEIVFCTGTPNYLNPLIFDGSKWSTYNSFELSSSAKNNLTDKRIPLSNAKIGDIYCGNRGYGPAKIFSDACILGYQFLMENPTINKKDFLFLNLQKNKPKNLEEPDYNAETITQLILQKRSESSGVKFKEFFCSIIAEFEEEHPENHWLITCLKIILSVYEIIFENFSSSMSEEAKQDFSTNTTAFFGGLDRPWLSQTLKNENIASAISEGLITRNQLEKLTLQQLKFIQTLESEKIKENVTGYFDEANENIYPSCALTWTSIT